MPVKRIGDYEIIREVGKGAFGKVYLAERITNDNEKEQFAIKVLNDKPNLNEIFREVLNWKVVSHHKNILTFYNAKEIDGEILFISEYIESGSLEDQIRKSIIKNLSFEEKIELILGILNGLQHLHENNIIHRDLKPANILIKNKIPLLADFGLARNLDFSTTYDLAGTPLYAPPEWIVIYRNREFGKTNKYEKSKFDDMWAVSCILQEVITGNYAFDGLPQIEDATPNKIININNDIPDKVVIILKKAFQKDPNNRFQTVREMVEEIKPLISKDMQDNMSAIDYSIWGDFEYRNGDYPEAEKHYRKAIEIDSTKAEYYYKRGVLLFHVETRWQEAEELFVKSLAIEKNNAMAKNCFGFLRYVQGRDEEAIQLFEECIKINKKLAFPYINLSAIYKKRSEGSGKIIDKQLFIEFSEKAEDCLKKVDHYLLACFYSAKRDKDQTLYYLRRIIEIEKGKKISARCSPTFDWIRDDPRFAEIVGE